MSKFIKVCSTQNPGDIWTLFLTIHGIMDCASVKMGHIVFLMLDYQRKKWISVWFILGYNWILAMFQPQGPVTSTGRLRLRV